MATLEAAAIASLPRRIAQRGWLWLSRQTFNPVLVRDGRAMFRGRRMIGLQLLYLAALMAVMGISSWILHETRRAGLGAGASLAEFGQWIFIGVFETQAVLLLLIVVAHSAGAISLEREKQTYEALAVTRLSSAEVVLGKIGSITALCYLLLFTSLPLAAFSLFFGGVSPGDMAVCYGLLALKLPLWAALGVMASILARRSIGAHVLALVVVGAENALSLILMDGGIGGNALIGLFSPFLGPAPATDPSFHFRLFNWPTPSWLLPIPYAALVTALLIVGAAEAMPHYRPQRSRLPRSLLLAVAFFMVFLMCAIMMVPSRPGSGPAGLPLIWVLALVWMWAVAFVPVFTSYPPDPDDAERTGWAAVGPARWLERDARSGAGFCLLLWGAGLAGALAAVGLSVLSSHTPRLPSHWPGAPELVVALAILALAIIAYSAWGATLVIVHRLRREAALATLLIILAMNSIAAVYATGYHLMRKVPSAPALVLASPAAAASALLTPPGQGSIWDRYTPEQALWYGLGYSLALLCGAYWYYRAARRRQARSHDG
jgi:hypothetical protein